MVRYILFFVGSSPGPHLKLGRADSVYMVPPFLAYFGVLEGGMGEINLLQVAYDQCRLYREGLRDENGLWRHIAQGSWEDTTHWATGEPP